MRRDILFLIFGSLSLVFLSFSLNTVSACTPDYTCNQWSSCSDGIQQRSCIEIACGFGKVIERRLCISDNETCEVKYECSEWSECTYTEKTQDVIQNKVRFSGYQERSCVDLNGCADSFLEDRGCADSFKVRFEQIEQCGMPFIVAVDVNSNRRVSEINLGTLNQKRLDISFVQGNSSYCPNCYNNYKDGNELGVDCGGACKACVVETGVNEQTLLVSGSWAIAFIMFLGFVSSAYFNKRIRMSRLIYRAYREIESKNKAGLAKTISELRSLYKKLNPDQQVRFQKDLEKLYRRI